MKIVSCQEFHQVVQEWRNPILKNIGIYYKHGFQKTYTSLLNFIGYASCNHFLPRSSDIK
jgi:hypothetical protein